MALEDYGLLALRLALGIIFIYHGFPKLKNPEAMAQGFGGNKNFPMILGFFEFVSGLLVLFGLYTQFATIVFIVVMLGALYYKIEKWKIPFFAKNTTGWEFDLLILASSIALLFLGAGQYSLDFTLLP